MRRRALLASTAASLAGIAGCASLSARSPTNESDADGPIDRDESKGAGDDPDGEPDDDPNDEQDDPLDDMTSVIELETGPRTLAFGGTGTHTTDGAFVQLSFDRTATADHPARLSGTLRNDNEYANTFELQRIPAVGAIHSATLDDADGYPSLHLAPTEQHDLAETVPSLGRTAEGYWQVDSVGPWVSERVRLEPSEEVALEYVVANDPETSGRPTGIYEFRGWNDESAQIAVWNTDEPGPSADSRFAGRSIPQIDEETTTQWFHEADESTQTYLQPARERVELDAAIDFELVNNSHESVGCGHWNVHKLVDGEWYHVGPTVHTSDCRFLGAGARKHWTLRAFNGTPVRCDDGSFGRDGQTLGYLGGGTYGVVAGYGHPADQSGALVELVGDPVGVTPTEAATIQRSDGEVVVTTPAYDDGEHPEDATLVVKRTTAEAAGEDSERVIVEQLLGGQHGFDSSQALRNGIAAFEDGVERVEVRTDEHGASAAVGFEEGSRYVAFRGEYYELTAERPSA